MQFWLRSVCNMVQSNHDPMSLSEQVVIVFFKYITIYFWSIATLNPPS